MQTSYLQMGMFVQSLIMKIKSPTMELARNSQAFRARYKKVRGLRPSSTALDTLRDVIEFYKEQNNPVELERIQAKITKHNITL